MLDRAFALDAFFRKLSSLGTLSDADRQALSSVPLVIKAFNAGQTIVAEGERPSQCCVQLSGWSYRHKTLEDGRSQTLALNIAGDFIDLQSLNMREMDHTLAAMTSVQVACITHQDVLRLMDESRGLKDIFWRSILIDQAMTQQLLLNLGRRGTQQRFAHLLCEIYTRLHAVGQAWELSGCRTFSWPLSQARQAQVVGLSSVHLNRIVQALRAADLIKLTTGAVSILDWERLKALAGFDANYLGLVSAAV